jgi:hypothetical protein
MWCLLVASERPMTIRLCSPKHSQYCCACSCEGAVATMIGNLGIVLLVVPSSKINEHTACLRDQVTYLFRLCVDISVINTRVLELGLLKTERYGK